MLNHHAPSDIAALKERLLVQQPGQDYFLELLMQQEEPVTLVMTGMVCCVLM
jgi:inosine-uridine nucleoside N-ribohydrolase